MMTMTPKQQGYQDHVAYCMNTRKVSNPFPIGSIAHQEYEAGWKMSQADIKYEEELARIMGDY